MSDTLWPLNETHDPERRSWVESANGHAEFPIQNLPFGVFRHAGGEPRGGVAIGDSILDLQVLADAELLSGETQAACLVAAEAPLNRFLALGVGPRQALRRALSALLVMGEPERHDLLHAAADCMLELPARVGDYTDFYAGIHHAYNVGKLFRPDDPLLPNYRWVPIGYHGRASSVRASGGVVRRPNGQRKPINETAPTFGSSRCLDFELELGIWVGAGNELGEPVSMERAHESIAGYCLLNDWSARDIQSWEYQPLGPFLGKSFHTTVSCWVVTPEALAPFRRPAFTRAEGDPQPLEYLWNESDQSGGGLDIELEVLLLTPRMRELRLAPQRLSLSHAANLYWTSQQMVAHHASNGCNLRAGDLLGTGTISAATDGGLGSLLEMTRAGQVPVSLASGEERRYLEDGDEVMLRAVARREGFAPVGFGECRAVVAPAFT